MRRALAACAVLAVLAGERARAQSFQHPPATPVPPEGHGGEVEVRARPRTAPVVAATYPAQGAQVAGGTLILKVAFDQHMQPDGWSYARLPGLDMPACAKTPRLLPDGKTFVLLCATVEGRSYGVALNADPPDGFADPGRRFAARYELRFSTDPSGEPVRPIADALAAAGLGPADGPVMNWRGVAETTGTAMVPEPQPH